MADPVLVNNHSKKRLHCFKFLLGQVHLSSSHEASGREVADPVLVNIIDLKST